MAKRKKPKKKMRGERVEVEKKYTACCVCGSSDQNCKKCKCAKKNKACLNCRRGAECQNEYGNKTSESIDVNEKSDENRNESQGPTRRSKRQEDQKKKKKGLNSNKNDKPDDIEDVMGDGNCFFRCLSIALHKHEEEHKKMRENVVQKMNEDKEFYKQLIDEDYQEHIDGMKHSDGRIESWATEAEIIAASETYNIDIFVYREIGNDPDWHLYTKDRKCHHARKYVKILNERSHYKLVLDQGRPCKCEYEQEHHSRLNPESENTHCVPSHTRKQQKNRSDCEHENMVDEIYNTILHFHSHNIFMPNSGHAMNEMRKEMTKLILEYVMDSPRKKYSLKMLMSMPKLLLQKEHRRARASENNKALARRMKAWQEGKYEDLLNEAIAIQERLEQRRTPNTVTDRARSFRKKMEMGHVRQASRMLQTDCQQGILPVNAENLEKLREKHPEGAEASKDDLLQGERKQGHPVIYNKIDGLMVKRAAINTKGSAGPSGMDANIWRMMLTSRRNPLITADLQNAIAGLAKKMCIEECQHLEPITNSRLIPLKNQHSGVRPIGVGEVLRRIIGRCVMNVLRDDVQKAAGNLQVCAGQQAGAEAAIHAMREIYNDPKCEAVLLIDASNAFNTLNRKAMLHNIGIVCPTISNFVENTYKIAPRLIISRGMELRSNEGTTQGDPIAMAVYALGLSVLQRKIDFENTGAKHVAYADDIAGAGSLEAVKKLWEEAKNKGPSLGYHPNANKSYLIVKPEFEKRAKELFEGTNITITVEGHKHLGAVIGSPGYKDAFVKNMVDRWVQEIQELSTIAKTEPHAAYTNFIFSMKQKWNYAMRTIPDIKCYMEPLEKSIREVFLPALLACPVSDNIRDLLALPARMGGMGIINPVEASDIENQNSTKLTGLLTSVIVEQSHNGIVDHECIKKIKKEISQEREKRQRQKLSEIENSEQLDITLKRKLEMNQEKGASNWLSTLPIQQEGFSLSKEEFHTAIGIRYGLPMPRLPEYCPCGSKFTVDHAMICKKGGFVSQRHNELRDTTRDLMSEVCKNTVSEPLLQPLSGEKFRHSTANTQDNARLDLSADDFWIRGQRAFFDVRVFDPVAPSYITQKLEAAHKKQEDSKRLNYEERVIEVEHASFTPLVFTVAGGMGKAAQVFYNRIAEMIADSRGQPKSVIVAWMRTLLSFSLVRSAVRCVRGTRTGRSPPPVQDTDIQASVSIGRVTVEKCM